MRINRVTPITPTSLVDAGAARRAATARSACAEMLIALAQPRRLRPPPRAADHGRRSTSTRPRACSARSTRWSRAASSPASPRGPEPVYAIGPDQHLTAAYYRNTIIHFFVNGAIAELALLRAAEDGRRPTGAAPSGTRRCGCAISSSSSSSSPRRTRFRDELRDEIALHDPDVGGAAVAEGRRRSRRSSGASARSTRTACCGRSSRPIEVVGDALGASRPDARLRRDRVPRALPRARHAVPAPAPHPQRRVGLEGALRDRAPPGARTAACSSPGAPDARRRAAARSPRRSAPPTAAATRSTSWPRAASPA